MDTRGKFAGMTRDFMTGRVTVSFELTRPLSEAQIAEIKDIEDLDIKAEKHRKKRSLDANGLLWHCIGQIAVALNTDKWEVYLQMLKRYGKFTYIVVKEFAVESVKRQWRECEIIGDVTVNGQKGVQMLCYFGSSTYNTKEFSTLLNGVVDEMQEMGLQPPLSKDVQTAIERYEKEWEKRNGN